MRSGIGILAIRAGLTASVAAKNEMISCSIVSPAGCTRKLIFSITFAAVVMTKKASVVGVKTKVAVRTFYETVGAVKVIVDDASHISAVGTVRGIVVTGIARLMAFLARVVQGQFVPSCWAIQHAFCQVRMLIVLFS